ncbi:methylamine utilization protein MauG, putative [Pseudooceanicola batsensis HTCC2597]|uniref:Methylamine utilization protein MauG, putative n=1 Tax=Pseudooceanicola batsensis (strain ATCC BAA-863 / DSM 15984 / KCTC 12145 / HTCC2597) TaxID=252305 RepID=A3TWQ9_PSEBH|nr:cytochrome c peroxidase [Pseudooceanicola batsensis]EAQ04055.1 methylamine utilization protein MauG, putative [Pseudooceanicola batsensis HTCC2597]
MKTLALAVLIALSPPALALDLGPRPVFPETDFDRVQLGWLLFYDPILSGNRGVSCATCHHPDFGTSDGVSLAIGDGGLGLGPERSIDAANPPEQRIPRNAPGLWNLGAAEFTRFFHDGRLELDPGQPNGIRTPLGADMTEGFDSPLAAQAMFPVLSGDEMAGHYSENEISTAVRQGLLSQPGGAWERIARRVAAIPEYREKFETALPAQPITFAAIANVIADFITFEWRADDSLFDRAMQGRAELPPAARRGMTLFYGKAGCSDCHSGWLQTDHGFHAIAMPQFGPGKAARFESHARDEGRHRVTGDPGDAYAFRTPSLRNVTITAPYGHSGAYPDLESVVRHHLDPVAALRSYRSDSAVLPDWPEARDDRVLSDPAELEAIAAASDLGPRPLSDAEVGAILSFLETLEDRAERLGIPEAVPSGLPVVGD